MALIINIRKKSTKYRIKNDYINLETIMRWRTSLEAAVLFGVLGLSGKAYATENGQQTYPIGIDTVLNAIVPAPGTTQFYDYSTFYTASRFVGQNGGSAIPGFKVNVFAMAPRVLHTWGDTLGPVSSQSIRGREHKNTSWLAADMSSDFRDEQQHSVPSPFTA
ncbi:transporter family protein [Paraburkholderia nemoris]|uniref:hypothetical protein n=1 Tax=Paraburkholderia nemoris TaxID=2793076 RepID=UPI0038BD1D83